MPWGRQGAQRNVEVSGKGAVPSFRLRLWFGPVAIRCDREAAAEGVGLRGASGGAIADLRPYGRLVLVHHPLGGAVKGPEHIEDLLVGDDRGVKLDLDGLGTENPPSQLPPLSSPRV